MSAPIPAVGDAWVDHDGLHWRVEAVTMSERIAGFFVVRLAVGPAAGEPTEQRVLARGEFHKLCRERGLRAVR